MNKNRLITVILSTLLIAVCHQICTPVFGQTTKVEGFKVYSSAGSVRAADSFILVSDLDDTVKITNVPNKEEMYNKGWHSELVFAGMPKLYQYLLGQNSPAERLMFLSGTPSILYHKVRKLLDENKFPAYTLNLRSVNEFFTMSSFEFKTKRLEELYPKPDDNFILIGDDTEFDLEAYEVFAASVVQNQKKVLAIYIHKIRGKEGKKLPDGSFFFVTAYDIALREFKAHRLSEKQAAEVGKDILDAEEDVLLPNFQWCSKDPKNYEQIAGLPKTLEDLKKKIEDEMVTRCVRVNLYKEKVD